MKRYVALYVCFTLACSSARADSWALDPEVKDTEFVFGDTRIVLHYDSTQNQQYPKHKLSIFAKGTLVGEHSDIGFEQVFASPDKTYFLGVSNRGLVNPAYVIFDCKGKVLKSQPHDGKNVDYFEISPTLIRKWYSRKDPNPRFTVIGGKLQGVRVNAWNGARVSLMVQEDLSLRAFLLEDLWKTFAKPKETCYVSFGNESTGKGRSLRCDPPKRFLWQFQNRPFRIKAVSAYPEPQGMEPFPPKNPQTGVPDGIYTVEIVEWLDENTARVKAGMYRHGEWASGKEAIAEKRHGKWMIKKRVISWIS